MFKEIKYYCSKCGIKMVWKQDYAEKETNQFGFRFDKYDTETGQRQIVGWWECPKYHWWNGHDSHIPKLV